MRIKEIAGAVLLGLSGPLTVASCASSGDTSSLETNENANGDQGQMFATAPRTYEEDGDLVEDDNPSGQTQDALTSRQFCRAAMYAGVALGCAAAITACSGTSVVTIGGTIYPCALVLAGACSVAPIAAQAYIEAFCAAHS